MSQYQMAIVVFLENKKTKQKDYKFYDYFSNKQGIHNVDLKPENGFEIVDIKIAQGRTPISELYNQALLFKKK